MPSATRKPVRTCGMADGITTRKKMARRPNPSIRPALMSTGGTEAAPAAALR